MSWNPYQYDVVFTLWRTVISRLGGDPFAWHWLFLVSIVVFGGGPLALAFLAKRVRYRHEDRPPVVSWSYDWNIILSWGLLVPVAVCIVNAVYYQTLADDPMWSQIIAESRPFVSSFLMTLFAVIVGSAFGVAGVITNSQKDEFRYWHEARACGRPKVETLVEAVWATLSGLVYCFAIQSLFKVVFVMYAIWHAFAAENTSLPLKLSAPDGLLGVGSVGTVIVEAGTLSMLLGFFGLLVWWYSEKRVVALVVGRGARRPLGNTLMLLLAIHLLWSAFVVGPPLYAVHCRMLELKRDEIRSILGTDAGVFPTLATLANHADKLGVITDIRELPVWPMRGLPLAAWSLIQLVLPFALGAAEVVTAEPRAIQRGSGRRRYVTTRLVRRFIWRR